MAFLRLTRYSAKYLASESITCRRFCELHRYHPSFLGWYPSILAGLHQLHNQRFWGLKSEAWSWKSLLPGMLPEVFLCWERVYYVQMKHVPSADSRLWPDFVVSERSSADRSAGCPEYVMHIDDHFAWDFVDLDAEQQSCKHTILKIKLGACKDVCLRANIFVHLTFFGVISGTAAGWTNPSVGSTTCSCPLQQVAKSPIVQKESERCNAEYESNVHLRAPTASIKNDSMSFASFR